MHCTERFPRLNEVVGPRRQSRIEHERPKLHAFVKTPREIASVTQHLTRQVPKLKGHAQHDTPAQAQSEPYERRSQNGRLPGTVNNRVCMDGGGKLKLYRSKRVRNSDTYLDLLNLPPPSPILRISTEQEPLSPTTKHKYALPPTRAPRLDSEDLERLAPRLECLLAKTKQVTFCCPVHKSLTCICHARRAARPDFGKADSKGIVWATGDYLDNVWFNKRRAKAFTVGP